MAFYPNKLHVMNLICFVKAHPEIAIFLSLKSDSDPIEQPSFFDRINNVSRIGVNSHLAVLLFQGLQTSNNCHQFHAVIGCQPKTSRKLFLVVSVKKKSAVSARPGITQ